MRPSRLLAAALALSLSAPALGAGGRKPSRRAAVAEAPLLAILDVAAAAGAFGCGTWASHEAELSAVLRDHLTTELSDRAEGRLRLVGPSGGEPPAADDAAARTRGKLLGARTVLAVQVTRLSCRPAAGASSAPAPRAGKGAGRASGKDAKKQSTPGPRPSAGTKLELSGRLALHLIDVETGTVLATLQDENAIVEPAGSAAGGAAALEYDDELATRLVAPAVERLAAGVVRKLP